MTQVLAIASGVVRRKRHVDDSGSNAGRWRHLKETEFDTEVGGPDLPRGVGRRVQLDGHRLSVWRHGNGTRQHRESRRDEHAIVAPVVDQHVWPGEESNGRAVGGDRRIVSNPHRARAVGAQADFVRHAEFAVHGIHVAQRDAVGCQLRADKSHEASVATDRGRSRLGQRRRAGMGELQTCVTAGEEIDDEHVHVDVLVVGGEVGGVCRVPRDVRHR